MILKMSALLCNKHLCTVDKEGCTPTRKKGSGVCVRSCMTVEHMLWRMS